MLLQAVEAHYHQVAEAEVVLPVGEVEGHYLVEEARIPKIVCRQWSKTRMEDQEKASK